MNKGLELIGTVFFILTKQNHKISFLHLYNRSSMFPIWWIYTAYFADGTIANAALINSLLHILMNFYFVVTQIGSYYQRLIWWKKYLTALQMVREKLRI